MNKYSDKTIDYYNTNSSDFINDTKKVEFSELQNRFLSLLPEDALILDLGCGSGRDSRYFLDKGSRVTAVDASLEMCRQASVFTGLDVINATFEAFETAKRFDGIWACASLVHVERSELPFIINKYAAMLKKSGIFYLSFKYGDFEGLRGGRYFNDLTEELFMQIISDTANINMLSTGITYDVRPARHKERWLNCFLKKTA
ncbi:MAG TPA: SAM-dependent methyltransferase [Succinivibrionaceae bacterium]|nr:SAM-dependent methyltransferase [Succinivibrionaceae bacterium]